MHKSRSGNVFIVTDFIVVKAELVADKDYNVKEPKIYKMLNMFKVMSIADSNAAERGRSNVKLEIRKTLTSVFFLASETKSTKTKQENAI